MEKSAILAAIGRLWQHVVNYITKEVNTINTTITTKTTWKRF